MSSTLLKRFANKHRSKKEVMLSRSRFGSLPIFLFLAILGAFTVLPILYAVLQSLKPIEEYFVFPPRFFVQNPTFTNYVNILRATESLGVPFSRYLFNTLFVTIVGTTVYVVIASLAAYPLAKAKIRGMGLIAKLVILALLFKDDTVAIVKYMVISKLGFLDTYWAMIVPLLATSRGVFLMQQFITAMIPDEALEAARIDGANEFVVWYKIVMPSVKAGWVTVIIFTFKDFWTSNSTNYVYSENLKQLPTVLSTLSVGGFARMGVTSAVVVATFIPLLIMFVISQRSIMSTMAHSGLK